MISRSALTRRLAAAALALAALVPAFESHSGAAHLEGEPGRAVAIETAAVHAGSAAHFEAAGRQLTDSCELCARLASAGVALPVPFVATSPAPPFRRAVYSFLSSHRSAALLGAPTGRAPPIG